MRKYPNPLVLLVLSVLIAPAASAEHFSPPDWHGQEGATSQEWRFDTNSNPATPEEFSNSFGVPQAIITPGPA